MTNIDTQIIFDKNGNPIPQYLDVADKTGGSAGTMKPITGQNGAQFTQLTGRNVEIVNLFPRAVRTVSTSRLTVIPPKGAVGAILEHRIFAETGTFGAGDGHSIRSGIVLSNSVAGGSPSFTVNTDAINNAYSSGTLPSIVFQSGADVANLTALGGSKVVSLKPYPNIRAQIDIKGSFAAGQGVDSSLDVIWVF